MRAKSAGEAHEHKFWLADMLRYFSVIVVLPLHVFLTLKRYIRVDSSIVSACLLSNIYFLILRSELGNTDVGIVRKFHIAKPK